MLLVFIITIFCVPIVSDKRDQVSSIKYSVPEIWYQKFGISDDGKVKTLPCREIWYRRVDYVLPSQGATQCWQGLVEEKAIKGSHF